MLLGLAVQAKLMLAPAVLCTVVAALWVMPQLRRPVPLGAVFLATLTPTLLFEAFRLATLGSRPAWLASWQEFRHFSRGELAAVWAETLEEKWLEWRFHGPGVLALPLLGAALMLRFSAKASSASQPNGTAEEVRTTGWLLAAGGTALLVTWVWQSAQPSYRQAFGRILLLFAAVMWGSRWWQALWPRPSQAQTRGVFVMLGLFLLCASFLAWYGLWLWRVANLAKWQQHQVRRLERLTANLRKGPLRFVLEYGTLQDQVRAAGALKQSGAKAISPLVQHVQPYPVLAGLGMGLCSQPQQALVATFAAEAILRRSRDEFRGMCQQVFF
ncbi:MAG: hypothetical protein NZ869_02310 [Thermoanaerobaculum sp.]|nr:hypothetical protein [Thermoanaerobaculum sp.]MDW7968386.1 hypothetical protein [Thermoanaerobaculum sp.]